MKVLYLTNLPAQYRVDFFNLLGKDIELTVLFEREFAKDRKKKWINKDFKNFNAIFLQGMNVGNESSLSLQIFKWLRRDKYDIIIIGGYSTLTGMLAIEYLSLRKIPFLISIDGGFVKQENKLYYTIKKHFISKATAWLSPSDVSDKYLITYGANEKKIFRYPFSSIMNKDILDKPLSQVERLKLRSNLNIREDKVIITVGRFIHSKGFDVLIKACRNMTEDIGVFIIGDTPTSEYLELKNNIEFKNIYFLNFMAKDILDTYYKAADLFVLPTRSDVWGLVINEAMAKGLPIITTNKCVAGLELISDNDNGYIIPANNEEILFKRICEIFDNYNIILQMREENISKIRGYTIEAMVEEHLKIFNILKVKY